MTRKQNWVKTLFLMVVASLLFLGWVQQESAKELFEKALYLEETKGELEKAIDIYKRVVEEFPEKRSTAARAQLQIGICLEKLGFQEAEKAFQKVVDNYPDQKEAVKLAREKLSILQKARAIVEKEDQEFKMTEIPIDPEKGTFFYISPDGKKLASVSGAGDIWVIDIASGNEIRLTETPEYDFMCFWSPDSQKIAYLDAPNNLYVVSAQGGTSKTLIKINEEFRKEYGWGWPTGWSPDSQYINCFISKKGLVGVPISGGEWKDIFRFSNPDQYETDYPPKSLLVLSPNEKYIAYNPNSDNINIYIRPTEGGEAVQITDHPAKEGPVSWSYDNRWMLFISERNGEKELWVIGISPDGKPEGEPFQIPFLSTEAVGAMDICWTLDNQIGFSYGKSISSIFVSNIDGSEEVQLTYNGFYPKWSPDNKNIAFISGRGGNENIWVKSSVQGGEPKNVSALLTARPKVNYTRGIAWHPDGRRLSCFVLNGSKREVWTMDIQSGEVKRNPFDYDGYMRAMDWSPDGSKIAFCYSNTGTQNAIKDSVWELNIYTVPAEGGEATRLTWVKEEDLSFSWPRWSPDGKRIAFNDSNGGIWTVSSEGGEPHLIVEKKGDFWPVNWSPDGETIYFTGKDRRRKQYRSILYSVSSQGGEPRILIRSEGVALDLSPDGKKLAYRKSMAMTNQFWLLENFLPEKKKD